MGAFLIQSAAAMGRQLLEFESVFTYGNSVMIYLVDRFPDEFLFRLNRAVQVSVELVLAQVRAARISLHVLAKRSASRQVLVRKNNPMTSGMFRTQYSHPFGDGNRARTTAAPAKRKRLLFNPRSGCFICAVMALTLSSLVMANLAAGQGSQEKNKQTETTAQSQEIVAEPGLYPQLTEPPCSYCVNQDRKGLLKPTDPVIAWIRGAHNGGAAPIEHFLTVPRVINDTYGLFFYDADGQYITVFEKDYGFEFYGWRGGVMVVRGRDGSLWSALSGQAFAGPQKGKRLKRFPSLVTHWGHWLLLHPESTAYDLFDGKKYPRSKLPTEISEQARQSMGQVDPTLSAAAVIMGVEGEKESLAVSLDGLGERACFRDKVDGRAIAVLWYGPTRTAVAYFTELDGKSLTLYADKISPETAPFKDRETGSRWTLAGRAVDGPLRGKELTWVPSVQCRWYAWSHEYPHTRLHENNESDTRVDHQ